MLRKIFVSKTMTKRWLSAKPMIKMNELVNKQVENAEIKPKKHPGIVKTPTVQIPDWVAEGMLKATTEHPFKNIRQDAKQLESYLHHRHPPPEAAEVQMKLDEVKKIMVKNFDLSEKMPEEVEEFWKRNHQNVQQALKQRVYAWTAIEYNAYKSLCYMAARGAQDYAILYKIFYEISHYDKHFKPKALFDFGSGIGTVVWAASQFWKNSIKEYYCVDSSVDMNKLAETIIGDKPSSLKGVYFRQFLPATAKIKSDIVVSAFSLFEMPNAQARLDLILNLWLKTNKYLIIVEQGTNAGFKLVNEARDFLLDMSSKLSETDSPHAGHVFAPCPHDTTCPRYILDRTPCNFLTSYFTLPLGKVSVPQQEIYSYVVMKKGKRADDDERWPRIVRSTMVRSKHTICRMCTASGKLEEVIFTASKHGKIAYKCAKYSHWGDKLPLQINDQQEKNSSK